MSLYTEIFKIHPYLKSIRTLEEKYFSIDIKFSKTWRLPKEYVNESKVLEHQSDEPNKRYISFVSQLDETDLNETISNLEFDIPSYEVELPEEEYTLNSIEDNEQRETDRLVSEGANKG